MCKLTFNPAAFLAVLVILRWCIVAAAQPAPTEQTTLKEHVAAMKSAMAASEKSLRQYEWIETTVISVKGDEKSSIQKRCYYGADGKVQKLPIAAPAPEEKHRGIRGKIIEKKKEEISDYMRRAAELVHTYVPPVQESIQKVLDAGNVSIAVLEPKERIRLDLKDYQIPGDTLGIEMTLADSRLASISVATLLADGDKKEPITLKARVGTLEDGTSYTEQTVLDAKAKEVRVVVTNSGYRKQ